MRTIPSWMKVWPGAVLAGAMSGAMLVGLRHMTSRPVGYGDFFFLAGVTAVTMGFVNRWARRSSQS
jgi:hypothetical protein